MKAVHRAWTVAESLTLVVSPSARQSEEFVRKLKTPVRGDGDNAISIELPDRSRIVELPGIFGGVAAAGGRGGAGERRVVPGDPADAGGERTYERGGPEWERFRVPATECARIRPEVLEDDRRAMGEAWFRQEYMCEFVDRVSGIRSRLSGRGGDG